MPRPYVLLSVAGGAGSPRPIESERRTTIY